MKTSLLATSVAAALLGLGAIQAASAQTTTSASALTGGNYVVEPGHTQVEFKLLHIGFTYYSGVFSNVSGTLVVDPAKPSASKLDVTIPINSVMTTSAKLDGELKGAAWFDADKFATATFVSSAMTRTGKGTAKVAGVLTLHGVSKPETLMVRFIGAGVNPLDKKYTAGFEATGTIKRSDFGVKTYLPLIGDEVKLTIAGAFERQG